MGKDSERPGLDSDDPTEERPTWRRRIELADGRRPEREDKIRALMDRSAREVLATGQMQPHFIFWLGGIAQRRDPEASILLDLLYAGEITPAEAMSEEPARWVQMLTDLQAADGITETPSSALDKWRRLSPTAQRLVVEKIEGERNDRLAKGLPTEPTARDRERLERGNIALGLGEPESNLEILLQLEILHTGIAALQSTDDLGSSWANERTHRHMMTLVEKYKRLRKRAAEI